MLVRALCGMIFWPDYAGVITIVDSLAIPLATLMERSPMSGFGALCGSTEL